MTWFSRGCKLSVLFSGDSPLKFSTNRYIWNENLGPHRCAFLNDFIRLMAANMLGKNAQYGDVLSVHVCVCTCFCAYACFCVFFCWFYVLVCFRRWEKVGICVTNRTFTCRWFSSFSEKYFSELLSSIMLVRSSVLKKTPKYVFAFLLMSSRVNRFKFGIPLRELDPFLKITYKCCCLSAPTQIKRL